MYYSIFIATLSELQAKLTRKRCPRNVRKEANFKTYVRKENVKRAEEGKVWESKNLKLSTICLISKADILRSFILVIQFKFTLTIISRHSVVRLL